MTAAIILALLGALMFLIAFGTPREDGDINHPGFLIPWYALPIIGTAAAIRLWPGAARRAAAPLAIALTSLSGWCAVAALW